MSKATTSTLRVSGKKGGRAASKRSEKNTGTSAAEPKQATVARRRAKTVSKQAKDTATPARPSTARAARRQTKPAEPKAGAATSASEIEARLGIDLREAAARLENATPEQRIAWALEAFPGKIAMSSSFGAQSAVSLHMISRLSPGIPVILIDTGYLFPETYRFIEELTKRLSLNLKVYSNPLTPAFQEVIHGKLWEQGIEGIEKYNDMNKVQPMNRALADLGVEALFSGLRRQQSSTREKMPVVVSQRGRVKVHPIIDWTDMDVGRYLVANHLPYHPLWDEGYVSIGDWHTSRRLTDGMTAEETRFFGLKRECGLHEGSDFQI